MCNETVIGNIGGEPVPEIPDDVDVRVELARMIYVLAKIRDIVTIPDPRWPTERWYKSQVEHIRRYVAEVLPGDDSG